MRLLRKIKAPKASMDSLKSFINNASKQFQPKKTFSSKSKSRPKPPTPKSGLTKDEAVLEIDRVNKEILALQTVKEFCKSSYENGLAKFYEIENQIAEMQEKVSLLQDEYEVDNVIDDGEACTLMAEAALKSCKETLSALQEKQENSAKEAQDEAEKIDEARDQLQSLRQDCVDDEQYEDMPDTDRQDVTLGFIQELNDMETMTSDKSIDLSSSAALTVTQLAEKIDVLVNKVISLETAVSSQTVLINTMRSDSDELREQIKQLESEKETLMGDMHSLSNRIKELEDKLSRLEELNSNVEAHNSKLEANFAHCRCSLVKRDLEIQHLKQELSILQGNKDGSIKEVEIQPPLSNSAEESESECKPEPETKELEKEHDIKLIFKVKSQAVSVVEEGLRMEIDAILDENLDFWLRFSTAFHQVQKFKSEAQDLLEEIAKLRDKKKKEGSMTPQLKSEVRPIYKHLREIQTELTMWLEQRVRLKDELKRRFTSLCGLQEEITTALKEGVEEDEIRFSSHQAAKLQGEILSMKQENNKVREELQTCVDHVSVLQLDIEKTLRQLNQEFSIGTDQPQLQHTISRSKIPLRAFIFGNKVKKQRSLFNFMHTNRKMHNVRTVPTD
ncbi:LOW QUALITY PROTEIN: kinase-interacting protein 1-like [Salvia hispanica]|uniref:LOW QUALITY PROTEIN: kinase-interacting protein 1-like n=1 Tax=Salvia hispanica TaxID=49212 RepID=UPI00200906F5|nr:LOW QUALITY PROTEIN: kinase-interacting protein 1-like [Salvia hispanica]